MQEELPDNFRNLPPIIYKYRNWLEYDYSTNNSTVNRNTLKLLNDRQIFFASPASLNDPFDCSIPIKYPKTLLEEDILRQTAIKMLISEGVNHSYEEIVQEIMKKPYVFLMNLMEKNLNNLKNLTNSTYKIFSSSSLSLNQLLWSHYANSHTGICVGLDTQLLIETIYDAMNQVPIRGWVDYQKEFPVPTELYHSSMSGQAKINMAKDILLTKGTRWKYEKEFRFVVLSENERSITLPKECFKSFHLGLKMQTAKKEIIGIINKNFPDAKVYGVDMSEQRFNLVRTLISTKK